MTGEEYLSKLNNLWENINKDNIDEKKQEINTLSKIIPKRLKYFAVQARLHQLEGNDRGMYEALQILMEKYWGLYYYNGLKEIYDCYIYNSQYYNDYEDVRRLVYDFSHISLTKEQTQYEQILRQGIKSFYENGGDCASMEQLASIMYIRNDYVMYVILKYAIHKIYDKELSIRKWVKDITNIGYLTERLDDDSSVYIVIVSDNNGEICDVLANVLALLEKKVFVIRQPEIVETSKKLTEGEILRISIENKEEYDEFTVYPAVKAMCENNEYCDNTGNLINYISESLTENHLATLLCSGECFNNLEKDPILKKNTSRLFGYRNDYYETEMSFGWTGDYLSYISVIYKSDFKKVFMKSPQCDFSIVIPARNSAYTLRYTIMTCLNIEYRGSYEIVISDNSSDFNRDVYNLVREFNDEKIKYYKTPRNLQLAKSFEFACLNAKGEFIIPLGSDDGIMPYTLTEINKIMEKYPEEDIIQWERGFYAWPGFNDGQQNEFVIPRKYNKLKYETEYVSTEYLMALILNEPSMMYSLPLMYVNSGFRRRYLKRILERTGRLWDGICQDLYMGIVNITINKRILMVKYPMTIAGMSSTSIGCLSNKANRTVEQGNTDSKEIVCTSNIGGYVTSCTERLIPQLRSDVSSLYLSILRLVARGVIPQTFLTELFDFKKWFIEIIGTIKKEDVYYDKYIHYIRHVVKSHNEDFQKWFEEKVWPILIRQSVMETSGKENLRSYDVGVNAYGGVILDASEYCVENILDAVELLKDMIFKIK
ncbi:MAG TPA: glycosyltransferase [Lachnospiraceae bacterium]|nr:glycosyltransferase [Lachnospiraceae bacterium]